MANTATYPKPYENCVEYPITGLTADIVKNLTIHSTRSSIRRAGAIKQMIFEPANEEGTLPALTYIFEGTFDRDILYANVNEYNEANDTTLTAEDFARLDDKYKVKVVETVKMYSLHALSCDISKHLLLNSLETEGE